MESRILGRPLNTRVFRGIGGKEEEANKLLVQFKDNLLAREGAASK